MKISALRLYNVKRFAKCGVAIEGIGDGINVLCAENEFGKSTSFEALHALFFQPHTGVPKEVRRMQPYSGGNPLIEADIITQAGRYRLSKQFIGGKRATVVDLGTGRLVAQADEAENFISGLVNGGMAGPAGLLWVRQGVTGIEEREKKEEEGERKIRESLLTSVQGEVEAITGGRRMAEIIEACADELNRLITPSGKPKTGGPYCAAIDERDRLTGEEKRLHVDVMALRDALDQRAIAQRRLVELENPSELAARRLAVKDAETAFETAKAHRDTLNAREAETALAGSELNAAESKLTEFRSSLNRVNELRANLEKTEQNRVEVIERRGKALSEIEKATADVRAAEAAEQAMRDLSLQLDAVAKARRAREELISLQNRLEQAEGIRNSLEVAEAELALLAVSPDTVDRLQALEIKIAALRAAETATRPTVRMAYGTPGEIDPLIMDGTPLLNDESRTLKDLTHIEIPNMGTLTLWSKLPDRGDDSLEQAEAKKQALLSAIGVKSLLDARNRQAEAQAKSVERDGLRLQLNHVAPDGIARLHEQIASCRDQQLEVLEIDGDREEVRRDLAAANDTVRAARNRLAEFDPERKHTDEAVIKVETLYATLEAELARFQAILGPEEKRAANEQALVAVLNEKQELFDKLQGATAQLRSNSPDLESVEATLRRKRSVEDAATKDAAQLRETLAELNGRIRTRSEDAVEEAWREAIDALEAASSRVKAFETEVKILERLKSTLQASRSAARDLYLRPILTELRPLLGLLFSDVSIVFDDKTLLPQKIRRNGQDEDVDRLSGGMREQLSILTRLAFARLLARDGRSAPVILDDALVFSDDDRIERMFDALHREARDQQIIVFSCRQRAFSKLGGNVLRATDWQPEMNARE
ncbi:MAG: AAA family ATPase [Bradyrhizobium sp.]|nr:AAA family ATPase [Bradyrhizobium sp.]